MENHKNLINLVGKKFGKLMVTSMNPRRDGRRKEVMYKCLCDCGNVSENVFGCNLSSGKSTSCGCNKKCINKEPDRIKAIQRRLYQTLVSHNNKKALYRKSVELKFEEFKTLIAQNCFYCGKVPSNYCRDMLKGKKGEGYVSEEILFYTGIDRVDNQENYKLSNCIPCCKECNFCKGPLTQKDFLELVIAIYKKIQERSNNIEH